jgi:hypothetical protein
MNLSLTIIKDNGYPPKADPPWAGKIKDKFMALRPQLFLGKE